jgi:hypothetical protein
MRRRWSAAVGALMVGASLHAGSAAYYDFMSDTFQALHLCHWAARVDVNGRRPLVDLVLSLDEQRQKLNQAREVLLPFESRTTGEARRAVEGLLNGIELYSLINADDFADINAMNNRWELAQRLDGRRDERAQAMEVMAASMEFLIRSMGERDPHSKKIRSLLSPEEADSLWRQVTLLFGEDLARSGTEGAPFLSAVDDLRKALKDVSRMAGGTAKSP